MHQIPSTCFLFNLHYPPDALSYIKFLSSSLANLISKRKWPSLCITQLVQTVVGSGEPAARDVPPLGDGAGGDGPQVHPVVPALEPLPFLHS